MLMADRPTTSRWAPPATGQTLLIKSGRSSKARTEADTSSARQPRGVNRFLSQTSVQPSTLREPSPARAPEIQHRDRFGPRAGIREAAALARVRQPRDIGIVPSELDPHGGALSLSPKSASQDSTTGAHRMRSRIGHERSAQRLLRGPGRARIDGSRASVLGWHIARVDRRCGLGNGKDHAHGNRASISRQCLIDRSRVRA
jgi:hypothetical protein